jgi:AAA15 family ATPase/GTPase
MEENKHLTYFKVENFKCFESFEMDDIGQFNLIVGDNNVGKTSVLEALLLDGNLDNTLYFLSLAFKTRLDINIPLDEGFNFMKFYLNKKVNSQIISYNFSERNIFSIELSTLDKLNQQQRNEVMSLTPQPKIKDVAILKNQNEVLNIRAVSVYFISESYVPFIPFNLGYGNDLIRFYSERLQKSAESKAQFIKELDCFIPNIHDIEISTADIKGTNLLNIRIRNIDEMIPLPMFGEGANKLFRILSEIVVNANGKLLIDEVDTGIHYSRFKQYWKTILISAKRNSVQLFMTTHSQECLKYFKEALEELGEEYQNKSRHFLLKRDKSRNVMAKKFSFEQFQYALEHENEIRD